MGAQYAQLEHVYQQWPQIDLQVLQHAFFTKIKKNLFKILDEGELELVQICTLLSSFYLYNGSPNLAFIILDTGVRCAQAMSLHRESTWPVSSQITREEQKRVWWALYVFDWYGNQKYMSVALMWTNSSSFTSMVFGKPCMISDSECDVSMVENMPDTAARHPALSSTEIGVDRHVDFVTIFSYQRYKFKLYQIASPIIGNIYLYQGADAPTTADKIQVIHKHLHE